MGDGELIPTDELIRIGRDIIDTIENDDTAIEVRVDRLVNMGHAPVVYALTRHCLRLGTVVLDLHERGLRLEAMPTARSLYEIAITAQWLAQSREAINAFFNEDVRQRKALSNTMAESASAAFREGASEIAHLDKEDLETIARAQGQYFEQRCRALAPGAYAYALYRAMSWYCHPTGLLADQYAVEADNPAGVELRPEPDQIEHDTWLYISVAAMVWASRALDLMRKGSPNREYLRSTARALGTTDVLRLTDEARAAEEAAAKERRHATWKGPKKKGPGA